ncbi:MAG: hypothetical protein FJ217_08020 [Ignavibacteria bacterium]|nr:hypothetical protein [Ignavibacteria bacterium]
MPEQLQSLAESLRAFWGQFLGYLPKVFGFLVVLLLGWFLAKFARSITIKGLKFLRVDVIAEKSGIEDFLLQGGVRFTTVTLVGNLVYWFIMFAVVLALLNAIGLQAAAELFNKIILYIPNVVITIIVLIFGTLFAKIIQGVSYTYLSNVGIVGAQVISTIAQYAVLIFVVSIALEQLSIGGQVLVSAFQIAFGAFCLALALAFGLGGRDWASRMLDRMLKK